MAWSYPLTFDLQGAFLLMCSVSLVLKKGGYGEPLILKQGFAPLSFPRINILDYCHDDYCKVFTRDTHWLFNLLLLLLPFQRANRRPIVNALTGIQLSLISENANGC